MVITATQAQQALADIQRTEGRGQDARTYRAGAHGLVLWGCIWIVAYTATALLPQTPWWTIWGPANLIGFAGTAWLYRAGSPNAARTWCIVGGAVCFLIALYLVDPPRTALAGQALPPLLVSFLYVALGALRLTRYVWIGAALFTLTLLGVFALPHLFGYWMAAIGGATLIGSGLWLRHA